MDNLTEDVLVQTALSLPTVGDVLRLRVACRAWLHAVNRHWERVWKHFTLRRFPRVAAMLASMPPDMSFAHVYREQRRADETRLRVAPRLGGSLEDYLFTFELYERADVVTSVTSRMVRVPSQPFQFDLESTSRVDALPAWWRNVATTTNAAYDAIVRSLHVDVLVTRRMRTSKIVHDCGFFHDELDDDDELHRMWFAADLTELASDVHVEFEPRLMATGRWGLGIHLWVGDARLDELDHPPRGADPDLFERHVMNALHMLTA